MLLIPTLSRAPETDAALDQKQLYAMGLDHVRRLSRRLWTDHNLHDPGITTLELLCYALTDLAYRSRYSVEDLLASPEKNAENMAAQFFTPRQILPNRPLTERDYRKLLIDLPDVKNAWIYPVTTTLYADTIHGTLSREDTHQPGVRPVNVSGQYGVRIEYMDSINTLAEKNAVRNAVGTLLQANRNLCEDFVAYEEVESQPYALCAELELKPDADQTEVAAQIRFRVERYLAPPVRCYSLSQMLKRTRADGSAYTVPEIFEGPALQHGFIDDEELDQAALREEIRLSDIISLIMDIPGVLTVRDIVVNELKWNGVKEAWDSVTPEKKWRLQVPSGKQPTLSDEVSRLVFYKRSVPIQADSAKVIARIMALEEEERLSLETVNIEDIPIPLGRNRDTGRYHSFQHHFPEIYGISDVGLPTNADAPRRAQALQLKAYLLFFDQVMANYFAQLSHLNSLFRLNFAEDYALDHASARTAFAQRVNSFLDADKVYAENLGAGALEALLENEETALARRNQILDHMLARFAEQFHHYVGIMRSAFGASPAAMATAKSSFLMDYPTLGAERGLAYNKSLKSADSLWNSLNVSGLERRIARLLGIGNFSRRNLGAVSYDLYAEIDKTSGDEFRFRIKHPVTGKILLSSSTNYATQADAHAEMQQAIESAQLPEGYVRKTTVEGKHYFNVVNSTGEVIARRIEYFASAAQMDAAIETLTTHLREYYSGEGLYLIENLLLLSDAPTDPLMPICVDPDCTDCADADPYSYRVHVVLPAYAGRFRNMDFRRFVEETIRQEMPAHILPKICWINEEEMAELETAYRNWIPIAAGIPTTEREKKIQDLIRVLYQNKNVYPTQQLRECGSDESKPPFIIGRTALGSEDVKA
jgi:uncharacterized protein